MVVDFLAAIAALLAQAALAWEALQAVCAFAAQAVFSVQFSPARNERVVKAANVRQTISFFIGMAVLYQVRRQSQRNVQPITQAAQAGSVSHSEQLWNSQYAFRTFANSTS